MAKNSIFLNILFIMLVVGGCSQSGENSDNYDPSLDLNNDYVMDIEIQSDNEFIYHLVDRNFDTKIDESIKYDKNYTLISSKVDDNFDGLLETTILFKNGSISMVSIDSNTNGIYDIFGFHKNGVLVYSERYYEGRTNSPPRIGKIKFEFHYPVSKEVSQKTHLSEAEFSNSRIASVKDRATTL